jgi:hypothetical protein
MKLTRTFVRVRPYLMRLWYEKQKQNTIEKETKLVNKITQLAIIFFALVIVYYF